MPAFPKREKASGAQAGGGQALTNPLAEVISPKSAFGQKGLAAQELLARAPAFASLERGDVKDAPRGKAKAGPAPASSLQDVRKEAASLPPVWAEKGTWFRYRNLEDPVPRRGEFMHGSAARFQPRLRTGPSALAGPPRNPERFERCRVLGFPEGQRRGKT